MKNQNSPILKLIEGFFNPEITHYEFLETARNWANLLRKHKNKQAFVDFAIKHLSRLRQKAEHFFSDDLGNNKAISTEEKNRWLAAHQEYIDQIFFWIDKVLNGTDTKVDIARLEAKRDNLIEQSSQHLWARIHEANKRAEMGQRIIPVGEVSKLLDSRVLDRANRLIEARFAKRQGFLSKEITMRMQKANKVGMLYSSPTAKNVRAACEEEIKTRAEIVWDSFQRAHKAVGSPLTETLGIDLKAAISSNIEKIVREISEVLTTRLNVLKDSVQAHHLDLESTESTVIKEIDVEVDLYVDQLICERVRQNRRDGRTKTAKKKKVKAKKLERKYKPWKNPPDVCFVIVYTTVGDWTKGIHFYQDDKHSNLRLRSGSRVEMLLTQLKDAYLAPEEIKSSIGKDQTKASDIVTYANKLLNKKIRGMSFMRLPDHEVAFVLLQIGRYECAIPIYTKKEFEQVTS